MTIEQQVAELFAPHGRGGKWLNRDRYEPKVQPTKEDREVARMTAALLRRVGRA